jgi:hypothetical protein
MNLILISIYEINNIERQRPDFEDLYNRPVVKEEEEKEPLSFVASNVASNEKTMSQCWCWCWCWC